MLDRILELWFAAKYFLLDSLQTFCEQLMRHEIDRILDSLDWIHHQHPTKTWAGVWILDHIKGSKIHRGVLKYQVHWNNWPQLDPGWYPAADLKYAADRLKQFHDNHPDEAGPPLRLQTSINAIFRGEELPDHMDDSQPAGSSPRDFARPTSAQCLTHVCKTLSMAFMNNGYSEQVRQCLLECLDTTGFSYVCLKNKPLLKSSNKISHSSC